MGSDWSKNRAIAHHPRTDGVVQSLRANPAFVLHFAGSDAAKNNMNGASGVVCLQQDLGNVGDPFEAGSVT